MLTITTAATDLTLLTVDEMRAAVGVTDGSKDAELLTLETRVAAAITAACRVVPCGSVPPTLRQETLTETVRLAGRRNEILLSRMPIVSVTSVTEVDTVLTGSDFEIEANAAVLRRLSSDAPTIWAIGKTVVVYVAGWTTVPVNLKLAASKLAQSYWAESTRTPGLRSMSDEIPGVRTLAESYQDKESDNPAIPFDVMELLAPYINHVIG